MKSAGFTITKEILNGKLHLLCSVITCRVGLYTHKFESVTCGFELVACVLKLVTRIFELALLNFNS